MFANRNVSEPKPLQDEDSPLSFTMEGYKGVPPFPDVPFFWAPGWNSVQSLTKYQQEPGGSLKAGEPGTRLFSKTGAAPIYFKDPPEPFGPRQQKWLLLPQYHVLGSGELSSYTNALQELTPQPFAALSPHDASQLNVKEDDRILIHANGNKHVIQVKINEELNNGVLLVTAGLPGTEAMNWGGWAKIERKEADS
jgi:NADH-quinone oxidoreductase subunit G